MEKLLCPNCQNEILEANINETSGLAKCEQCGAIQYTTDLNKANTVNDDQEANTMKVPAAGRSQVRNEDGDYVKIFLPKAGFGCKQNAGLIFILVWIGIVVIIVAANDVFTSLKGGLAVGIFGLIGLGFLYNELNNGLRTETLEIDNQQLTLTKTRFLLGTKTKVYDLNTLQGAEFHQLTGGRSGPTSNVNLISANGKVNFFKSETDMGKKGLARYLDQVIKNARKENTTLNP